MDLLQVPSFLCVFSGIRSGVYPAFSFGNVPNSPSHILHDVLSDFVLEFFQKLLRFLTEFFLRLVLELLLIYIFFAGTLTGMLPDIFVYYDSRSSPGAPSEICSGILSVDLHRVFLGFPRKPIRNLFQSSTIVSWDFLSIACGIPPDSHKNYSTGTLNISVVVLYVISPIFLWYFFSRYFW